MANSYIVDESGLVAFQRRVRGVELVAGYVDHQQKRTLSPTRSWRYWLVVLAFEADDERRHLLNNAAVIV